MTRHRSLVAFVGVIISAAAVAMVLQTIDFGEAIDVAAGASPAPLLAIVGVVGVQTVLRARRWSVLLPTRVRLGAARLVPPLLIGYLGNALLPARLGEPMRAVVVARREELGTTEALGSVVVERVLDVATLAAVAFVAAVLVGAPTWTVQGLGIGAAAGVGAIAVLITVGAQPVIRLADRLGLGRRPVARQVATRLASTLGGPSRRSAVASAASLSIAAWLLDGTSFWLAGQAVGVDVSYVGAMLIAGVTVLGTAVPSAPGYVGTFELAAAGTAAVVGVPGAEALAMAILAHVMTLIPLALGGAVSMLFIGASLNEITGKAETAGHG